MFRKNKFFLIVFSVMVMALQNASALAGTFDLGIFKSKRPYLYIVGSSTVSPFMSTISEEFSRNQNLKKPADESKDVKMCVTPVVESTGSTSGFQMFCGGVGYGYPDFVSASRLMKENELENCHHNGVKEIAEIKIGYDGIVFGNVVTSKKIKLTKEQVFLALAEKVYDNKKGRLINNPYQTWNQISANLPKTKIVVYGPPLTSGTRDVFADIVLEDVCFMKKEFVEAYPDREVRRRQCHKIRSDGQFVESGENDNLIIQHLRENPDAFGIFGFNFLVANQKTIQASSIDGIVPTFDTIASKKYELSRPLFVYFKKEHLKLMPEMSEFIEEIVSDETLGSRGYLLHSGLISLSDSELKQIRKNILAQLQNDK